jgi:4-amino-4-deoxy-L-arabinose transferase-like glycosyltransferase
MQTGPIPAAPGENLIVGEPSAGAANRATPADHIRATHPLLTRPHRWWLVAILLVNGALELWDLQRMGWQNTFYAAAAWSAGKSWHAFFFAGLDPVGGATIDKPPLSPWVQGLSVRVFGFEPAALLLPQVVMAIGCSALLYLTVRRLGGTTAGLLAAAAMTFTPVGVWMFKGDDPDPLMVLLLVAAAYFLVRALDSGGIWWMVACGAAVGFAFEAKMLEAAIVLPALVLTYLICGGGILVKRLAGLLAAGGTMLATGLWWMVVVQLTPPTDRPYISSTNTNSVFDLAFGYNGAARLGVSPSSLNLTDRLFVGQMGLLISYLLPAALLAIPVLLLGPSGGRRSRSRAAGLLFGGWLLAGAVTLTYSTGLINVYYVLVIAPPVAALVAIAGVGLWRHRAQPGAVVPLTLMVATTAVWGTIKLHADQRLSGWIALLVGTVALGLIAFTLQRTLRPAEPHPDSSVAAAPDFAAAQSIRIRLLSGAAALMVLVAMLLPTATASLAEAGTVHEPPILFAHQTNILSALSDDRSTTGFAAAVVGGRPAAELELQTGRPVLDIGGYHGDNALPTLPVLEHLVSTRQIHYFIRSITPPQPRMRADHRPAARRSFMAATHKIAMPPAAMAEAATALVKVAGRAAAGSPIRRAATHLAAHQSLASRFTAWVAAHYRLVYSNGSDDLYNLYLPVRSVEHDSGHLITTTARHHPEVLDQQTGCVSSSSSSGGGDRRPCGSRALSSRLPW